MNYGQIEAEIAHQYTLVAEDQVPFHHWNRITETLESITNLAEKQNENKLSGEEIILLKTAALTAFVGYLNPDVATDYLKSAFDKIDELLPTCDYSTEEITQVKNIIRSFYATLTGSPPQTLLEKIFTDAYYCYLASDGYYTDIHNIKRELERQGTSYSVRTWYEKELDFLQRHHYHTPQAQEAYEPKKQFQIGEMKKLLGVN